MHIIKNNEIVTKKKCFFQKWMCFAALASIYKIYNLIWPVNVFTMTFVAKTCFVRI